MKLVEKMPSECEATPEIKTAISQSKSLYLFVKIIQMKTGVLIGSVFRFKTDFSIN